MKRIDCTDSNQILNQLIQQQEIFSHIKNKIQVLLPNHFQDQFNVVGVNNNQLIIYANSGIVSNYLKMKRSEILAIIYEWQIPDIKIKVHIKNNAIKRKLPKPILSNDCRDKLLNIASTTTDIQLKKLLLSIASKQSNK
ncbi:DUF721 domain-containing protein [Neisseriaceae bacterium PsAf]|nr:DUF721 domain-containing protein [Neisseriaceae bacterium PsAf]MCV2503057.1 DciA family protein [Neisseriaceae bacterium]